MYLERRLHSMSKSIEYDLDNGYKPDLDGLLDDFGVQKDSPEYDVYIGFLHAYTRNYEESLELPEKTDMVGTRYALFTSLGLAVGLFLDDPYLCAVGGASIAWVLNNDEQMRNDKIDLRHVKNESERMSLIYASKRNLELIERTGYGRQT